ncbi:family 78 glycoside hydrolase catalytic domain [Nocardioides dongxiaopingii]|uniref:family 78 glycoside hydrolase catalytic domain n=1 Tax=Nocardioides dongxiaopingii TaxID=2576036 RepID=UPI0010C76DEF|nr:family 78 glycoside hydrolase catalytic domain [Nocardioides dongxiaopingii]
MRKKRTAGLVLTVGLALTLGPTAAVLPAASAAITALAPAAPAPRVAVTGLEVNHLFGPLGIDDPEPVLCWGMESNVIGAKQQSYRIEVSRNAGFTNLAWDSGTVASDESTDIRYGGTGAAAKLRPETDYWWRVTVVDDRGVETTSETSTFSTGLMSKRLSAWDGAQWVGSTKTKLDSKSASIFDVSSRFAITSGDNVSFIFGADDARFTSDFRNVFGGPGGENFVRLELDLSGVTADPATNTGGVVNLYRKGYHETDDVNGDPNVMPYKSVRLVDSTAPAVRTLFTPANKSAEHTVRIQGNESAMTYTVDGVVLNGFTAATMTVGAGRPAATNNLNVSPNSTINDAGVHTFATGGNYNTFPNLNSVGFSVKGVGDDVTLTDYKIVDVGQSAKRTLFDATTGPGYGIFAALPGSGITTTDAAIRVRPTAAAQLGPKYADPSYGAQTHVRSEFRLDPTKDVAKARLYVTAQGAYEMFLNGDRVSDDYLNPGMATYAKTLNYHTYDVTDMLSPGSNAVGALLGPGFWNGMMTFTGNNYNMFGDSEALLARMVVTYADGTTATVVTDPDTWKSFNDGPNRYADNFQGVMYDARKESNIANWATTRYTNAQLSKWSPVEVVALKSQLNPDLVARQDNPVHEVERLTAERVLETHSADDHTWTYDMGVNMVGVPRITIPAGSLQAGDEVVLRFAETIYPGNSDSPNTTWPGPDPRVSQPKPYADLYGPEGSYRPGVAGRILTDTYRGALASDTYVASAADATRDVVFTPNFTFRGYQYIEISVPRRTTALPLEGVDGIVLSSIDMPEGTYEATTSDDNHTGQLANQFFTNAQRSQVGNFFSLPTDCPQRNERMGWTGDLQAYARSATYNSTDTQAFLRQWMVALRDAQGSNGSVGTTVPVISLTGELGAAMPATPTWEGAVAQAPWQLYTQYGDTQVIEENFATIQKWLKGYADQPLSGDYPGLTAGTSSHADHISMDANTGPHMVNQAMYLYFLDVSSKMADVIGESAYAQTLRQRYTQGVDSFNKLYVDPQTGFTLNATPGANLVAGRTLQDSQASYATPLALELFSDEMTIQAGPDEGLTYQEFATRRLAELIADPARSNNGNGPLAGTGLFSGGQASNKPYTITTGFNATPNILPALTKTGQIDTAYKLFSNDEFASWLYPVTLGATSMWELWNSYERGFAQGGNSQMNSQNHFALGASQAWMYEYQLGITSDGAKGYKDFVLQPVAGGDFTALEGSFDSSYGTISSSWTAQDGEMTSYAATVPANTTATLYLPVDGEVTGFEDVPGVTFTGMAERNGLETATFEVGAGGYAFEIDGDDVTATIDGDFVPGTDGPSGATTVAAPAATGTFGQPTTITATVTSTGGAAAPTGTVTVSRGTTAIGSGAVVDGVAKVRLAGTSLPAGTHALTLAYGGDPANASSSGTVAVRIGKASSSIGATLRPQQPKAGTRPRVRVTVKVAGVAPTGAVKIRRGGKVVTSGQVRGGKVVLRLPRQAAGRHTMTIRYVGTDDVAGSSRSISYRVIRRR